MIGFLRIVVIRHCSDEESMMNTLPKSLVITFLLVSILISGLTVDIARAQDTAVDSTASQHPADPLQSRYIKFARLTAEDGLSGNQVLGVAQDERGFIWFGTADGLSRYDGSSVKVYRNDPDDPNSMSLSFVRAMLADQSGNLWVGTWGGG